MKNVLKKWQFWLIILLIAIFTVLCIICVNIIQDNDEDNYENEKESKEVKENIINNETDSKNKKEDINNNEKEKNESAQNIKMIDLIGKNKNEAEKLLKELGFKGNINWEKEYSESLKEGLIIKQSINEGIECLDNEELILTLSTDLRRIKVKVPNTIGLDEKSAKEVLENAGFAVLIVKDVTITEASQNGKVIKQDITDKAEEGSIITLTIGAKI